MRRSLAVRIASIMVASVLASLLIFVIVVNGITSSAVRNLAETNDRVAAERVAPWIERYYRQTGSLRGIETVLDHERPGPMMTTPRRGFQPPMNAGPIAVFGNDGHMLVGTNLRPETPRKEPESRTGIPIRAADGTVARVYVGSMLQNRLGPVEEQFLRSIRTAGGITLLIVAAATMLLVSLMSRIVVRPLRAIGDAAAGIAKGDYATNLDTTRLDEIGTLARTFEEMASTIEGQEALRRQFIADSAHELRTPVTLLSSQLEMIEAGIYPTDSEQLRRMRGHLDRMQRVVGDLGTLASFDAGAPEYRAEAFDPAVLVSEIVEDFSRDFSEAAIRLNIETAGEQTVLVADRGRLAQVLTNLLSNARKFTPPGGNVTVRERSWREGIRFEVEDTGPGIPEEYGERVFDRFFRIDGSRNRADGGSGLGLAISREIVLRHGGSLWTEPNTPSGARFVCYVPFARNDS